MFILLCAELFISWMLSQLRQQICLVNPLS